VTKFQDNLKCWWQRRGDETSLLLWKQNAFNIL